MVAVMQACWRAITAKLFCSVITFKATAKGGGALENSAFRDLWLPSLSFFVLMVSVVCCFALALLLRPHHVCGALGTRHSASQQILPLCIQ